jgi:hypothetical protein
MPKVFDVLRNEVFLRVSDETLAWLDEQRGQLPRSTFIRSILEAKAQGELPLEDGKGGDHDAA